VYPDSARIFLCCLMTLTQDILGIEDLCHRILWNYNCFVNIALSVVSFDSQAAEEYALIRSVLEKQGTTIGANDYIIAATVLAHNGTLITNNIGEFQRVPRLKYYDWT